MFTKIKYIAMAMAVAALGLTPFASTAYAGSIVTRAEIKQCSSDMGYVTCALSQYNMGVAILGATARELTNMDANVLERAKHKAQALRIAEMNEVQLRAKYDHHWDYMAEADILLSEYVTIDPVGALLVFEARAEAAFDMTIDANNTLRRFLDEGDMFLPPSISVGDQHKRYDWQEKEAHERWREATHIIRVLWSRMGVDPPLVSADDGTS